MTPFFLCANIYTQLLVCAVKRIPVPNQATVYQVYLTDKRWHTVNRCTGQNAVISKPLVYIPESKWCDD